MNTADLSQPTEAVRLYHLALEWEIPPADLVGLLRSGGLQVESHFTRVPRDSVSELKATLARGREANAKAAAKAKEAAEAAKAEEAAKAAEAAKAEEAAEAEEAAKVAQVIKKLEAPAEDAESKEAPEAETTADAPTTSEDAPKKKKRKRKRTRRTKRKPEATTERPTRSIYGSGRLTPSEPAPAPAKPPSNNGGVAPSVPSFGKQKATPKEAATPASAPAARTADRPRRVVAEFTPSGAVPSFGKNAANTNSKNGVQAAPSGETAAPPTPAVSEPPPAIPAGEASPTPTTDDAQMSGGKVFLILFLVVVALGVLLFALSKA